MTTKASGLHLWKVDIRARIAGSCCAESVTLWITTETRSLTKASEKTNRFLRSRRARRSYNNPAVCAVKYRGTIDA